MRLGGSADMLMVGEGIETCLAAMQATGYPVWAALSAGGAPSDTTTRAHAENTLTNGVRRLLALAEAYPELKASENLLALQQQLTDTENDIASARRYYNAVVRDFNTLRESFPTLLIANPLGFQAGEFFELADIAERDAPATNLGAIG